MVKRLRPEHVDIEQRMDLLRQEIEQLARTPKLSDHIEVSSSSLNICQPHTASGVVTLI